MRLNRSIRNRGRRGKRPPIDLDITSLLDILVIMLVFLLKSYNATGIIMNVPKDITLPTSNSSDVNTSGVVVQVSPSTLWVDNQIILDKENTTGRVYDYGGRRIIPLFNELIKKKNLIKQVEKTAPEAQKFSGVVNLIVDKTIKYSEVKKILFTAAEAGYKSYKFVVLGEDN
ncbi:MAG: biopolymer transporter ExbD [Bacteriovoracaceae bacterium]|nr:biopolymer transporter ExbD [Bacteriovoracaceae bacterium]